MFDRSRVLMEACGEFHIFVGTLWSCGEGEYCVGHNDNIKRLIQTRVDTQNFDDAKIVTAAAGLYI